VADRAARDAEGKAVRAMMLGTFLGTMMQKDYPIKIRSMEEWLDEDDVIQSITAITESGFKLHVKVEYEGEEP
jgi:hypothetical protein